MTNGQTEEWQEKAKEFESKYGISAEGHPYEKCAIFSEEMEALKQDGKDNLEDAVSPW